MIMKKVIQEAFRGSMSEKATMAKEFLAQIEQRFVKNENVEIGTLLTSLISIRCKSKEKGKKRNKVKEVANKKLKRNQIIWKVLVVSSLRLKGIRRSIALIITHGILRKVQFLVWFILRLI